jgi:hypothetical protein
MPVEIRELVIRAVTKLNAKEGEGQSNVQASPADTEAIIQECVRQVMYILKKKEER